MKMEKKRILIVNKSFELGGIQMALANMLREIGDEYDVSLAVFNPRGPLKEGVPENVNIIPLSPFVQVLGMTAADCKKFGTVSQRLFKTLSTAWARIFGNALPVRLALATQKNLGHFDVAISYHQETNKKTMVAGFGMFTLKKCTADRKIAWMHADVSATELINRRDGNIYSRFDKIVSVSRTTMETFAAAYPELRDKCDYCYNCVPTAEIISRAEEPCDDMVNGDNTVLFSACRLVEEKGLLPALRELLPLIKGGKQIKWYIAGDGPLKAEIEGFIEKNSLTNNVILLGFRQNPYPFIKKADYLFLPSLHETFSMVVGEAHALGTPVIALDIPIMREVLSDDDILCPKDKIGETLSTLEKGNKSVSPVDTVFPEQFKKVIL